VANFTEIRLLSKEIPYHAKSDSWADNQKHNALLIAGGGGI